MTRSNLVDITVILHHETEKAYLVSDTGEREKAVWVPKSVSEIECKGKVWILTMPEHIAIDRRLV